MRGVNVPYRIVFTKPLAIAEPDKYINACCVGGDLVLDHLLPSIRGRYQSVRAQQEDWGWFAWFEQQGIKLAIDVHTDAPVGGKFQLVLSSRVPKLLFGWKVEDTPELETMAAMVEQALRAWPVDAFAIERADDEFNPV
jgi:hypothetical protein